MTIVAATKYVALAEMAVLVEAGIEVVGENRAQDLEAKHAVYGDAFRWHFIGRLQSNKVKVVNRICELVHSLDSRLGRARGSRCRRSSRSTSPERAPRVASPPSELDDYLALRRARALDDAARSRRPRGLAAVVSAPAELAAEHGLQELSMGTTQDYAVARRGGRDLSSASAVSCSAGE